VELPILPLLAREFWRERRGGSRSAKRDSDVPTSQQPFRQAPNRDRRDNLQPGRQYTFVDNQGNTVAIRDDSAGAYYGHGVALKSDGTVWAWGYNYDGELGNGTVTQTGCSCIPTPVQVSGLTGVTAIASYGWHTLALKSDGSVWAWGYDNNGQLGDNGTTSRNTPVQVAGMTATTIAAGRFHSLAVKTDGTLWAWGDNGSGELGNGTWTASGLPVQVTGMSGVTAIRGAGETSLALKSDGTLWAWGDDGSGELGDGTRTTSNVPVQTIGLTGTSLLGNGVWFSLAGAPNRQATTNYGYDKLYRLTSAAGPAGTTTYSYDPLGNRLNKVLGTQNTSYSYDRADRITAAGSTTYTVNADGNETGRGSDSFTYDQANRLLSASVGGTTSTYKYDGDGKRVSKTVSAATTNYVYDIGAGLPVLLDDGTNKYVWGAGGLAYSVNKSTAAAQVYHTDGLGSERALTSTTVSVTQTYQFDEFGVPTLSQGTSTQPFGFDGQPRGPEDGPIYLRARVYDAATGRFWQRDPMRQSASGSQGWNRYAYVVNNPATYSDPSGLQGSWTTEAFAAYGGEGRVIGRAHQECVGFITYKQVPLQLFRCGWTLTVFGITGCFSQSQVEPLGTCSVNGPGELDCPAPDSGLPSSILPPGAYRVIAYTLIIPESDQEPVILDIPARSNVGTVPDDHPYPVFMSSYQPFAGPSNPMKSMVLR
jgi:RHS repeat-associated protein